MLLHKHADSSSLLPLLATHLPTSIATYTPLALKEETHIYASFPSDGLNDAIDQIIEPWIILVDLGNQTRSFCSVETETEPTPEKIRQAEMLVINAFNEFSQFFSHEHSGESSIIQVNISEFVRT